jgi:hypothetical protein
MAHFMLDKGTQHGSTRLKMGEFEHYKADELAA